MPTIPARSPPTSRWRTPALLYEAKRLNFAENEQRKPEYLKINPKGRVPALVTDQGILTETPAILVYIAQSFPKANLTPERSVRPRTNPVPQQLPLLNRSSRPRSPDRGYRWSDDAAARNR